MSYRANPALDIQMLPHRDQGHGPRAKRNDGEDAAVLIDATMKETSRRSRCPSASTWSARK